MRMSGKQNKSRETVRYCAQLGILDNTVPALDQGIHGTQRAGNRIAKRLMQK